MEKSNKVFRQRYGSEWQYENRTDAIYVENDVIENAEKALDLEGMEIDYIKEHRGKSYLIAGGLVIKRRWFKKNIFK